MSSVPDISLSPGVRQSLYALQQVTSLAQDSQLRLSTGKKVNSAVDNPVSFFTSQTLSARANDLGSLLDQIGQSVSTVQAADNGIKALTTLVQNAQSIANQAIASGASTSKIQGTTSLTAATRLTTLGFAAGDTLTVSAGSTAGTAFTVAANSTVQDVVDAINADPALTGKARASINDGGNLVVETVDGSTVSLATSGSAAAQTALFGAPANVTSATAAGVTTFTGAAASINTTRQSLAAQFDALRTQIDQTARDAGYNGVNLLNGDSLRVQFNETNTSSVTISGVTFGAAGLGIGASANGFQSDADIRASVGQLIAAATTLRTQSTAFGSNLAVVRNRQDFTKSTINTLNDGSDALVLADQNEEAAKLATLNTRQQLASTALSLANQANQQVLRLFQ